MSQGICEPGFVAPAQPDGLEVLEACKLASTFLAGVLHYHKDSEDRDAVYAQVEEEREEYQKRLKQLKRQHDDDLAGMQVRLAVLTANGC